MRNFFWLLYLVRQFRTWSHQKNLLSIYTDTVKDERLSIITRRIFYPNLRLWKSFDAHSEKCACTTRLFLLNVFLSVVTHDGLFDLSISTHIADDFIRWDSPTGIELASPFSAFDSLRRLNGAPGTLCSGTLIWTINRKLRLKLVWALLHFNCTWNA